MNKQPEGPQYLIVVGASAGGLTAVIELCAQLDKKMDAAVCVVLHVSHVSMTDILAQQIQKNSPFICRVATDGEPILRGHVYMAAADKHLLVRKRRLLLGRGPAENRWRPSIDVLFRSAAVAYDGHLIGVILTGLLQDGTAGMLAIKKSGGICIVQDPTEAEYPDMPQAVLNNVEVDYCVSLSQMGFLLKEKTANGHDIPVAAVPEELKMEAAIAERVAIGINLVAPLGKKSLFTCPDCGGGLWEIDEGKLPRYRCHIGHAFTEKELQLRQSETLESTLWVALRMMEERRQLLHKMVDEEKSRGRARSASNKEERALELTVHIDRLKQLLFDTQQNSRERPPDD
jgi:two-component system chemotaxis response regulator CheB